MWLNRSANLLRSRGRHLLHVADGLTAVPWEGKKGEQGTYWCRGLCDTVSAAEAAAYFTGCYVEWSGMLTRMLALQGDRRSRQTESLLSSSFDLSSAFERLLTDDQLVERVLAVVSKDLHDVSSGHEGGEEDLLNDLMVMDECDLTARVFLALNLRGTTKDAAAKISSFAQQEISKRIASAEPAEKDLILNCLTRCQHTLLEYTFAASDRPSSYLLKQVSELRNNHMFTIQRETINREASSIISNVLNPTLRKLQEMAVGRDYADIFKDIRGGVFDGISRGEQINVIPGTSAGPCAPLLVAFAKSRDRAGATFAKTLEAIQKHVFRCSPGGCLMGSPTMVVCLITDCWDQHSFDKWAPSFSHAKALGVEFIFLLKASGTGLDALTEIKVAL